MQGIDDVLRVVLHDVRIREDRDPVSAIAFGRLDTVHAETTGQTSDTSEHGLECLVQVVRDVIFEHCQQKILV